MLYVLVAVLLVIVIIFGVASGMQSQAAIEQARAQIEVAQVAQVNAWGNLIVILVLALLIVTVLALMVWMVLHRMTRQGARPKAQLTNAQESPGQLAPPVSIETLIQLETLRVLQSMNPRPSLPPGEGSEAAHEDLHWLRGS